MLKIPQILAKAYLYAKSHKFLWFFGFFMTGGGVFNFVRLVNLSNENITNNFLWLLAFLRGHPYYYFAFFPGLLIAIFAIVLVSALARAGIVSASADLERRQQITFQLVFKKAKKYALR